MSGGNRRIGLALLPVALLLLGLGWRAHNLPDPPDTTETSPPRAAEQPARGHADRRAPPLTPFAAARPHEPADSAATACAARRRAQVRALRDAMDPTESADVAITHALLGAFVSGGFPPRQSTRRDIEAARKRWPDDVDLAWLEARYCVEARGCDGRAARQRWQALEPDNAAVWLEAMQRAHADDDRDAWNAALSKAAAADYYDPRLGLAFIHLRPALARLPLPPDCQRLRADLSLSLDRALTPLDLVDLEAQTAAGATAFPSLQGLQRCRPQDPRWNPDDRGRCVAVLRKIGEGDTFLERGFALASLIPLVDAPEGAQLRERYRRLQWLMSSSAIADRIPDYIPRMWAEGETAVLQDWLQRHGRWPPPPDWLPDDLHARGLILGNDLPASDRR